MDDAGKATRQPVFQAIEAQLFVANIKASCAFYTAKLGFEVAFLYGDPPSYAQVVRDHARMNLRLVSEPVFAGDIRQRESLLSASIIIATAREIEQLFRGFQDARVPFGQLLKKESWGSQTFIVSDPDGNLILFAGPSTD